MLAFFAALLLWVIAESESSLFVNKATETHYVGLFLDVIINEHIWKGICMLCRPRPVLESAVAVEWVGWIRDTCPWNELGHPLTLQPGHWLAMSTSWEKHSAINIQFLFPDEVTGPHEVSDLIHGDWAAVSPVSPAQGTQWQVDDERGPFWISGFRFWMRYFGAVWP